VVMGSIIAIWNYSRFARQTREPLGHSKDSLFGFMRRELSRQRDAAKSMWKWYVLPLVPAFLFIMAFRWMEEGPDLTSLTDMRLAILLAFALIIAFYSAMIFWKWLEAAKYQRQLDVLDQYGEG